MLRLILFIILSVFVTNYLLRKAALSRLNRHPTGFEPGYSKKHYLFGLLYYNTEDQRLLVPKQTSPGYTINFSKPITGLTILLLAGWLLYKFYNP